MIRTILTAIALTLTFTAEAAAQDWSHEGIAIPQRAGWCAKTAEQDDGSGGKISALEVRPCGQDMPYVSLGVAVRGVDLLDMDAIIADAAQAAATDVGKVAVDNIVAKREANCTRDSYTVTLGLVENVSGYDVLATYTCPTLGVTTLRTFNAYAQRQNGDVWVVAFDHPLTDIAGEDQTMIRAAIAAITAN